MPVLRTEADRLALWEGLKDGTIDAVVSDHRPVDQEEKELEFDYASFGSYQLQTVFSVLNSSNSIEINTLLDCLSHKARNVLGIQNNPIEIGERADLTVFDPIISWEFNSEVMISEHAYSPFLNKEMKGKVLAVINGDKASLNN
jgi:dihydroorotase